MLKLYARPESAAERQAHIDRIDELLLELGHDPTPEAGLVLEHLAGVRTYLIESMPGELALNLQLLDESIGTLADGRLRGRIQEFLKEISAGR